MVANIVGLGEFRRTLVSSFLAGILAVVTLTALGCDLASGKARLFRIGSASMAPRWLGPHRYAECKNCGNRFPVAAELLSDSFPIGCFCCGEACFVESNIFTGETVAVTPLKRREELKRLDVVVFRAPNESQASVKRIWGLPGETVRLIGGEMFVDGVQFQKDLQQFVQLAVPISRFPNDPVSHWSFVSPTGKESIDSRRLETENSQGNRAAQIVLEAGQRICFEPQRPGMNFDSNNTDATIAERSATMVQLPNVLSQAARMQPSEITDDYAINQGVSLPLHSVPDFLLALRTTKGSRTAVWQVHLIYRDAVYRFEIDGSSAAEQASKSENPSLHPEQILRVPAGDELLFALCDGRAFIATSRDGVGSLFPSMPIEPLETRRENDSRPLLLGQVESALRLSALRPIVIQVLAGELVLEQIVVSRDLWLGSRHLRETEWSTDGPLAPQRYWVLGDNLPVSVDGREAWAGGIARDWIEGTIKSQHLDWRQVFDASVAR